MSVSFNTIPSDNSVPLFYAEMDNSQGGGGSGALRRLFIGHANDRDTGDVGQLVLATRQSDVTALAGDGSMLAAMYSKFRQGDPAGEIWVLPVKLDQGVAAVGKCARHHCGRHAGRGGGSGSGQCHQRRHQYAGRGAGNQFRGQGHDEVGGRHRQRHRSGDQ
jgi:phage tail sheath gpL-like